MTAALVILALGALAVLAYCLAGVFFLPTRRKEVEPEIPQQPKRKPIAGSASGWFNVLSGADLLEHCKTQALIADIERQSRLSHEVFQRDMMPALVAYAEFVQLTPASEAHHHSHIGGLIAHTLEVVLASLTFRNGFLLPLHARTEVIDAQRDHWSYAVFFGALLHDVGKVLTDLQIDVRDNPTSPSRRWLPLSGALTMSRATEYEVRFAPKAERDYLAHQRLSLVMLQSIVPANALAFLGREQTVLSALTKYLSGDEGVTDDGAKALSDIIKRGDQFSVSRNLANGPRQRFITATAVPLNELLMQSIRQLLRDGTKLPLNRNGAAGWVFEGSVWFVAKRLADTVRKHVQEHFPDEAIPGGNKNDRLFDTWQDYGLVEPNPSSGGAVWRVIVKGADYELPPFPVLKFPLHRIFDDPNQYPVEMTGKLIICDADLDSTPDTQNLDGAVEDTEVGPSAEPEGFLPVKDDAAISSPTGSEKLRPETGGTTRDSRTSENPVSSKQSHPQEAGFKIAAPKPKKNTKRPQPTPEQVKSPDTAAQDAKGVTETGFLPSGDDVSTYKSDQPRDAKQSGTSVLASGAPPVFARVAPLVAAPPAIVAAKEREPDSLAIEFITWVQTGLANGALTYNQADSMVHIVAEGIALVSPRIFREYAAQSGLTLQSDDLVVQRKVIAAGWHAVAKKSNILHYAVISDGKRKGKLAAVVLREPTKWLSEVPPINSYLKLFEPEPPTSNA